MKVSACVIVKNEAKNIGQWLQCMNKVADELIVVDTGSDDTTCQLAEQAGAVVYSFPWCDDFAAAKNCALDQAVGDWILFLDADEYFSPQCVGKVRHTIEQANSNRLIDGFICRLLNIDRDQDNRLTGSIYQLRIFRHCPSLRYEGAIHEHLVDHSGQARHMSLAADLEIYHTGYSLSRIRGKLERNLRFIQEEIRTQGERPEHACYLMDCYFGLGQFELAEKYARKAIASGVRFLGKEGSEYWGLTRCLLQEGKPYSEIYVVLDLAMKAYPEFPEFPLEQGILLWEEKDYQQAEKYFRKGIRLKENGKIRIGADNSLRLWPFVYLYLGKLAQMQFDEEQAVGYFLQAVRAFPYEPAAFHAFYTCIQNHAALEIIEFLNALYDRDQDAVFLTKMLTEHHKDEVYSYYARLAEKQGIVDRTADYLAVGRAEAAVEASRQELTGLAELLIAVKAKLQKRSENDATAMLLSPVYQQKWKKKTSPLVSIMIPTYNRPELFEQTLQSALAQDYVNTEILICDNSTDDRTENLMQNYLGDSRIYYQRNREAKSKAENFQPFKKLAQGEYLQWLMDDDILVSSKLTKMVEAFRQHPEAMMATSSRGFIDIHGTRQKSPYEAIVPKHELYSLLSGEETAKQTLMRMLNFLGEPSAVLFRRGDLTNHYWSAECRGYKTISDIAMWLELLEKGDCIFFHDPLSYYRRHEDQEGQQQEVILLSRLEWYRLSSEYYARRVFLTTEGEYYQLLDILYNDYTKIKNVQSEWENVSNWDEYEACMKKIGVMLKNRNGAD